MNLSVLREELAVCRMAPDEILPEWALTSKFVTISRTHDELSIVCPTKALPKNIQAEKDWRAIKVDGPLDFGLTGILAAIAQPLADAKISIFAISTFDTDYVLVKKNTLDQAVDVLSTANFHVTDET